MRERAATRLVLNGLLVFFAGLLAGLPFGAALVNGWGDDVVRAWKLAHLEGLQNGVLLLALAGASRWMALGERGERVVLWGAVLAAWGNVIGALLAALSGQRGLAPQGPLSNWLVFLAFMFGMWGVLIAVPVAAAGAWRHLRRL
ncbi:MAG: hypothetical protein SF182_12765 [Deltaproteobacteria bacterium]|nr:hypothetical protein [Deltaproteobacteria bacterium]